MIQSNPGQDREEMVAIAAITYPISNTSERSPCPKMAVAIAMMLAGGMR
ncbi:MAG: hypothetical protein AB4042_21765 [Leptolyngbyaceae cyanobacterium]